MFLGERNSAAQHSRLTSVYYNDYGSSVPGSGIGPAVSVGGSLPPTPPDDCPIGDSAWLASRGISRPTVGGISNWLEIWDYAGGSSFRAFLAEDVTGEDKSLFVFFDAHILGRDLKQA